MVVVLLAGGAAASITSAQAAPAGAVGVLKPTVHTGIEHMMDKIPPQYRSIAQPSMVRWQNFFNQQAPLAVQNTWVEMLERRGIAAVPLEAATAQAARAEAEAKGVKYLLSSSAEGKPNAAQAGMPTANMGHGIQTTTIENSRKVDLTVDYALVDLQSHILVPAQHSVFSGVVQDVDGGGKSDVWADAGNALVKAVAGALPLGSAKTPPPGVVRPVPPEMTESIRLDVNISQSETYNGKMLPGAAASGAKASILAFAGDAVTTQDGGMGVIYTPGSPRLFLVNDKARTYSTMTAADLAALRSMMSVAQSVNPPGAVKLSRTGAEGKLVHYTVLRGEAPPAPEVEQWQAKALQEMAEKARRQLQQTTSTQQTTVDIEYGDPSVAWQRGIHAMAELFSKLDAWPVELMAGEPEVANAIWLELAQSPAPPLRVTVRDANTIQTKGKKANETMTGSTAVFATPKMARAVDFTVPPDYVWHTNPLLMGLLMMGE